MRAKRNFLKLFVILFILSPLGLNSCEKNDGTCMWCGWHYSITYKKECYETEAEKDYILSIGYDFCNEI